MALELSTAGVSLQYAVETTAGTRPTTGYTAIPNIKSIPDLNPEPESLEVTDLSDTEWKRYISGLRDVGGSLGFTANDTESFRSTWGTLVTAAETAESAGKAVWFTVIVPDLSTAFYFAGKPQDLGLSAVEVGSVLEITAYIAPNQVIGFATKPT
jgi:hypothetical protein